MSLRSLLLVTLLIAGCSGTPGAPASAGGGATAPGGPVSADGPLVVTAGAGSNVDTTLPSLMTGLPVPGLNFIFGGKENSLWSLVVSSKEITAGKSFTVVPFGDKNATLAPGQANMLYQADFSRYWHGESGTITFVRLGDHASGGTVARFENVSFKPAIANKATGTFTLNGTVTTVGRL